MLSNYLKIFGRKFLRNKIYGVINIGGLTLGLTCSILVFMFVQDELSVDKFHKDHPNIHLLKADKQVGQFSALMDFPAGISKELLQIDGISEVVRTQAKNEIIITRNDEQFKEIGFLYTDPAFLTVFNFPLVQGDASTALIKPYSIILSNEMVNKYFDQQNPIGKVVSIDREDYVVTGVFEELPQNTHLHFSILASISSISDLEKNAWSPFPDYDTYVKIEEGVEIKYIAESTMQILEANVEDAINQYSKVSSTPLTEVYFTFGGFNTTSFKGSSKYLKLFSLIGFFILSIACINYINLTTAKTSLYSTEIGIRKTAGAFKNQLVKQFIAESLFYCFASALISLWVIELVLPEFNSLTGKNLSIDFSNLILVGGIFLVTLFTGLIAGLYPSLLFSSLKPSATLKGQLKSGKRATFLRRALVSFQFILTVGLIFSAIVFNRQFNLLMDKGIGINTEALISIPLNKEVSQNFQSFKSELLSSPNVQYVSTGRFMGGIQPHIFPPNEEGLKTKSGLIDVFITDFDFLKTVQLELVAGRELSEEITTDSETSVLINQKAVEELGFNSPEAALEHSIIIYEKEYIIKGVTRDFYGSSAKFDVLPQAIFMQGIVTNQALVRLNTENLTSTVNFLKTTWNNFESFEPFEVQFIDDKIAALYQSERNLRKIFNTFAVLAIIIACLGLYGLINFSVEQKRKEIGIRKVLGASVNSVIFILTKEFLWLIVIGFIVAIPFSWYFMNQWLTGYAEKIILGIDIVLISIGIVVLIAMLTVVYQTIQASRMNPVDVLSSE